MCDCAMIEAERQRFSCLKTSTAAAKRFPALLLWLALAPAGFAATPTFSEIATLDGVFSMPESAAIDEDGRYIYVSNVNEYAKDGNGFISRLRSDGSDLQLRWLTGLDSPTGLAIRGETLFAADVDQLVQVSLPEARIIARFPSPDANPVLNDVAIAANADVYVSGSASRSIYRLEAGRLRVWRHDEERLAFANGVLMTDDGLVHGGQDWTVFDPLSREPLPTLQAVNATINDIDGITSDGCGGYLVTTLEDDTPWWIDSNGAAMASDLGPIGGIDLHLRGNLLAIPRVGNSLSLYEYGASCE